ncbi:MAG: PQQ-dependent dehydrogenase, methanol/ethanol family [Caenibius sp.]
MTKRIDLLAVCALAAVLPLAACGGFGDTGAERGAGAVLANMIDGSDGKDWPAYGRTYGERHYSPLNVINAETVGKLGLVSWLDLAPAPVATQPIAVDGVIYMSTGLSIVRAVDPLTGNVLWTYNPNVAEVGGTKLLQGWGNRGIAYWNGKVYTGTMDGRLIAIDAKTGKLVWSAQTTMPGDGRYITGAPRVMNGRVLIGHGGADSSDVRGYVTAYDATTGKQLWRFFTVPGNPAKGFENDAMEMAAKTWHGEWWKYGGGGNVWNAFSYDPETDTVFIGTGNGAPWNRHIRSEGKGDNLFVCSIVALDGKTGKYKWHYQVNPGESWDYNASMDMHLADVTLDGKVHKALIQAPKNGFLYVIDRENGKLLAANKIAKVTWAKGIDLKTGRPIENPGIRFDNGQTFEMWPSYTGAHSAAPSAFDPRTNVAFIPLTERGAYYHDRGIDPKAWKRIPGNVTDFGVQVDLSKPVKDPLHNTSYLLAVDPVSGKQLWKIRTPRDINGGLMVTGGNLVFQGQNDSTFNAYDSRSGKKLWTFNARAPIIGAPITYSINGKQYVSVVAGMGTAAGNVLAVSGFDDLPDYRDQERRLLTFALGGDAKLPAPIAKSTVPDDPDFKPDAAAEARGATVYYAVGNCVNCHGIDGVSGGGAPKLVRSPVIFSQDAFASVVRDGALLSNGMPRVKNLSDQQMDDLRQFLRKNAHDWRLNKKN